MTPHTRYGISAFLHHALLALHFTCYMVSGETF